MNRTERRAHAKGAAPGTPEDLLFVQRILKLIDDGHPAAAIGPLERAIRCAPESADYHAFLGQAQFRLGRYEEAEAALRRAVALRPTEAEFHAGLGSLLLRRGHAVPAVACFQRAVALDPGHWAAGELVKARERVSRSLHKWHLPMLADLARNDAFDTALRTLVRPDDIVLDIGTGTGLLAMMAARAGTRHVYACEMEPDIAELARAIIARNGLAERITVIPKPSSEIVLGEDLPAPATLLVTETFDSLLIGEGALESIARARRHLLAPKARVIPVRGRIMGQLAAAPRMRLMHPLGMLNGFDLGALTEFALPKRFYPVMPVMDTQSWRPLSAPARLLEIAFDAPEARPLDSTVEMRLTASGTIQGLVLWVELDLAPGIVVSAEPGSEIKHWNPVMFLFDSDRPAERDAALAVRSRMQGMALDFTLA